MLVVLPLGCTLFDDGVGECVPPATTPFTAALLPVDLPFVDGAPSLLRDAPCVALAVETESLTLECPDFEWSIEGTRLGVDFTKLVAVDDVVHLQYFSHPNEHGQNPWAILRSTGADDLLFAVNLGYLQAPFVDALTPLTLESVTDTECATTMGSCSGISRRAAIAASIDDGPAILVYDGNDGDVDDFRVQVGAAVHDEGNCEGFSDNRYDVAIYPVAAAR